MSSAPEVKPGQVWADNDRRSAGRTLRVDFIVGRNGSDIPDAICTILTNSSDAQRAIDGGTNILGYTPKDTRGKQTRVSLSRFKPTSTGYRLIEEASQ